MTDYDGSGVTALQQAQRLDNAEQALRMERASLQACHSERMRALQQRDELGHKLGEAKEQLQEQALRLTRIKASLHDLRQYVEKLQDTGESGKNYVAGLSFAERLVDLALTLEVGDDDPDWWAR